MQNDTLAHVVREPSSRDLAQRDPGMLVMDSEFSRRMPSWRWELVMTLRDGGSRPSRSQGKMVARAFRYFDRYAKLVSHAERQSSPEVAELRKQYRVLMRNYPHIALAHQMFVRGDTERFAIEALVCAGAGPDYIAKNLPAQVDLVDTYEKLFFDIRDRLTAQIFMINQVLMPSLVKGNFATQHDFVWKSIAYHLGVEALMGYISGGRIDKGILEQWHETIQTEMAKDALLASKCRVVNQYNATEVLSQYVALRGQEAENVGAQLGAKAAKGVDTILQAMTFAAASVQGRELHPIEERPFQQLNLLAGRGFFAKEALTA